MRRGELVAVVGASGCGKSTLLKVIAGLLEPTEGIVRWDGRDLATEEDLAPADLGYVPQFSLAYDRLTVRESVEDALRLRVAGSDGEERDARVDALLATTGLAELTERRVGVLSGGQRRRLALATEMVSFPSLLLCDEVTSGLDPGSAREIVALLHTLAGKLVLDLEGSAKDFDNSKAMAAIETARTVSAMHLAKDKNAAVNGDRATLEAELKAATEIWPRNPVLSELSTSIFSQADVQGKALVDFDQLLSQHNYRQIYNDYVHFIAATANSPERQEQLKKVLADMKTVETALERSSEIAKRGDYDGA